MEPVLPPSTRDAERALVADFVRFHEEGGPVPADLARALDELFAASQVRVYAVCRTIVGDPERARDLAQEAMLTGLRSLHTFRGDSTFGTWMYGIARYLCFNAVRRKGEVLTEDGVLETDEPGANVLSRLRRAEREELLRQAAATLDPLEQEAIHLRYVEGVPQERITELLGLDSATGARGLLQRCRRRLGRELRARLVEMGHGPSFFWSTR